MSDHVHMVSPLERALYLKAQPFFTELEAPELASMAVAAVEIHAGGGKTILDPDAVSDAFFHIVRGSVLVEGSEYPKEVSLGPGQGFGFLSALAGDDHGLDARAERDCVLLRFPEEALLDIAESQFYVLHQFLRSLARQILLERRIIADGTHLGGETSKVPDVDRDLTTIERMIALSGNTTFRDSGHDSLARLIRHRPERRFPAGKTLWEAGDPSEFSYMILSGRVRATESRRKTSFTCGTGYPLGNLETLAGVKRWYEAVTDSPVRVLVSSPEPFFDAIEDDFVMAQEFLSSMAQNLIRIRWQNQLSGEMAELKRIEEA